MTILEALDKAERLRYLEKKAKTTGLSSNECHEKERLTEYFDEMDKKIERFDVGKATAKIIKEGVL